MGAKSSVFEFFRLASWACVALATLGLSASPVAAVEIEWVPVGDAGDACDPQSQGCFGAVDYVYQIGKFEVTNAEYAEFLNEVAATDPQGLYDTRMGNNQKFGGITREGTEGSYSYSAKLDFEHKPVVYVTFYSALRFANWLHNGQGNGDTESGSYLLLGGNPADVKRNDLETGVFLPSEDEWYKAAYYDPQKDPEPGYFDYPTGTDTQTTCELPLGGANSANCWPATEPDGALTDVGAYTSSPSPWGTFDQGGNAWEWNEEVVVSSRGVRGGSWGFPADRFMASFRFVGDVADRGDFVGFRVATVPEPDAWLLGVTALLTLLGVTRIRRYRQILEPPA